MTYAQIKQRTYDILDMPVEEITRLKYAAKIPRIYNEAAFRIAQSILPNLREYTVKISLSKLPARVSMPPDFISFADEQDAYLDGYPFTLNQFIGDNEVILSGKEIPDYKPQDVVEYQIFYNAVYPNINDSETEFTIVTLTNGIDVDNFRVDTRPVKDYDIPAKIGVAIPYYIAGQLLARDDKVRSIECLNEFETLISVISTYRHERTKEYRSSKGWY